MAVRDGKVSGPGSSWMHYVWFWNAFIFTKIVFWDWETHRPIDNIVFSNAPCAVLVVLWGTISWGVVTAIIGRKFMR